MRKKHPGPSTGVPPSFRQAALWRNPCTKCRGSSGEIARDFTPHSVHTRCPSAIFPPGRTNPENVILHFEWLLFRLATEDFGEGVRAWPAPLATNRQDSARATRLSHGTRSFANGVHVRARKGGVAAASSASRHPVPSLLVGVIRVVLVVRLFSRVLARLLMVLIARLLLRGRVLFARVGRLLLVRARVVGGRDDAHVDFT